MTQSLIEEKVEAFEEELVTLSSNEQIWWVDKDNFRWNITNNINFIDKLKDFLRQALTEVQEAQKRSDVAVLENFKFPKSSHSCEWKTALDEAINKIK